VHKTPLAVKLRIMSQCELNALNAEVDVTPHPLRLDKDLPLELTPHPLRLMHTSALVNVLLYSSFINILNSPQLKVSSSNALVHNLWSPALLYKDLPLESAAAAFATHQWGNSLLEYIMHRLTVIKTFYLFFKRSSQICSCVKFLCRWTLLNWII